MSNNWRNISCPRQQQSGCILLRTHQCPWSPLGEGKRHCILSQLENCPVSSSSAVKWTVYLRLTQRCANCTSTDKTTTWTEHSESVPDASGGVLNPKQRTDLSERSIEVLFQSYHVCLHSDQLVARVAVSYKLCASTSAHHAALILSWFWCRDGIMGQVLDGSERAVAVCCEALWVGTHTSVLSKTKAVLWYWNKHTRPRGLHHSGAMAPVGWAQKHHFSTRCISKIC